MDGRDADIQMAADILTHPATEFLSYHFLKITNTAPTIRTNPKM
jgi:hypothetical protein